MRAFHSKSLLRISTLLRESLRSKRFLVLGKDGQVGYELCSRLLGEGVELRMIGRNECDLTNPYELKELLRDIPYDILINAAAYNFVDRAEKERDSALKINAELPQILAQDAKNRGARLIHYSSDYVFDGEKPEAYIESDKTNPLNFYGQTKLMGEENIQNIANDFVILRVSWVYSLRRHNFLKTMIRLAEEKDELKIVDDQIGSPTWARTIAHMTCDAADIESGLYHLTPTGSISWFNFASQIFSSLGDRLSKRPSLIPVSSKEFGSPIKRPLNSRLSSEKFKIKSGLELPDWKSELLQCLSEWHDQKE